MKYLIITVETMNGAEKHIQIEREDGSFESFPVDENNPRYVQFQADLAAEQSEA